MKFVDCPARVEGDGRRARMFTNVHTLERRSSSEVHHSKREERSGLGKVADASANLRQKEGA